MTHAKLRVLVVEDSAFNRRALTEMLSAAPDVEVVGKATDGDEGLRLVLEKHPDAITLDLGLPGLDGFTFLRILMAKAPTPVIVISSYSRPDDVFKALDLGAVDFIAKPTRKISKEFLAIRDELLEKIRGVRKARTGARHVELPPPKDEALVGELRLIVIGASTGGPPAIDQLLRALPPHVPVGVAIVQHMPPDFTRTFAERLDRTTGHQVREARDGDALTAGHVLIAPGGRQLRLKRTERGIYAEVSDRGAEKYCPSIDLLFESAATFASKVNVVGVVLTGMGDDGRHGAKRLRDAGATVLAESEDSAVVFGMPLEAIRGGGVTRILPLGHIAMALARFARGETVPPSLRESGAAPPAGRRR